MRLNQFLDYLSTQPWCGAYVSNLFSQAYSPATYVDDYITGAFTWNITPEGYDYWQTLADPSLSAPETLQMVDLTDALYARFYPTHPEYFI